MSCFWSALNVLVVKQGYKTQKMQVLTRKHCKRHNGPWVLTLKLELSLSSLFLLLVGEMVRVSNLDLPASLDPLG